MANAAKKNSPLEETEIVPATSTSALGEAYLALQYETHTLREMLDDCLEGGLQDGDLEHIRIPAGGGLQWELPNATGEEMANAFDGVIVGLQTTRSFWPEAFTGAGVPPECSSRDGKMGIGSPGGMCEMCPQNMWGSGRNGNGTACSERKRVYILRPEGLLPVILSLPVTSLKNLRKYQLRLLTQRLPAHAVVTRFSLERTKNKSGIAYSQVTCTAVGPLPDALAPLAKAYAKTIQAALGMQADMVSSAPAPSSSAYSEASDIPDSDPPFGPFAKTDKIPF